MQDSVFLKLIVVFFSLLTSSLVLAQTRSPGIVTPGGEVTCPSGFPATTCYGGHVACTGIDGSFPYFYGVFPATIQQTGTVVLFNGGPGDGLGGFSDYITAYTSAGFQTIQVVWGTNQTNGGLAWETATPSDGSKPPWSIKNAACRPAGLIEYLYNKYETNAQGQQTGAMCAQGASAGGAAIAYSLAEYGVGPYLDYVEFTSGPPLAEIDQGCEPPFSDQPVCGSGCLMGSGQLEWSDSPQYVLGAQHCIDQWTGFTTAACNPNSSTPVCTQPNSYQTQYELMSIIDRAGDSTFVYPTTPITGWLCSNTNVVTCTTSNPNSCTPCVNGCQNNSAVEGYHFFEQVTSSKNVYRVDQCNGPEGIDGPVAIVPAKNNESGFNAISGDMIENCSFVQEKKRKLSK